MKKAIFPIILLILLGLSFIPFSTVLSPEWKIRVVDEQNRPFVGLEVRLICSDYDVREELRDIRLNTDENGFVTFPQLPYRKSLFVRLTSSFSSNLLNILSAGHYSSGQKVTVGLTSISGKVISYDPDSPLQTEIVVKDNEMFGDSIRSKIRTN